jgi:hypothetical protein
MLGSWWLHCVTGSGVHVAVPGYLPLAKHVAPLRLLLLLLVQCMLL